AAGPSTPAARDSSRIVRTAPNAIAKPIIRTRGVEYRTRLSATENAFAVVRGTIGTARRMRQAEAATVGDPLARNVAPKWRNSPATRRGGRPLRCERRWRWRF